MLECPYNKAHRVQATAMARHLYKCRKMYPDTQFVICPFNHAHRIAEPELKMHTATCEDRANFDMYKYCITTAAATHGTSEAQEPELIYNNEDPIARDKVQDDDECWDDLRIPAYNPQEYCANAKIIRKATLKTPAEKRKFYEEEIQRHKDLDIKIKSEKGADNDSNSSRSESPVRRPLVRSRRRSRSQSPATSSFRRYRQRPKSQSRSRSPPPLRSHRSRSNSRKSRSPSSLRDRKRKRSRSRSAERYAPRRRSPTPEYSRRDRERLAYDRYEREHSSRPYSQYDYHASSSRSYNYPRYDRYSARTTEPYDRYSSYDRDEEHIYRRDFRD